MGFSLLNHPFCGYLYSRKPPYVLSMPKVTPGSTMSTACMMPSMALFTSSRCSGVISSSTSDIVINSTGEWSWGYTNRLYQWYPVDLQTQSQSCIMTRLVSLLRILWPWFVSQKCGLRGAVCCSFSRWNCKWETHGFLDDHVGWLDVGQCHVYHPHDPTALRLGLLNRPQVWCLWLGFPCENISEPFTSIEKFIKFSKFITQPVFFHRLLVGGFNPSEKY